MKYFIVLLVAVVAIVSGVMLYPNFSHKTQDEFLNVHRDAESKDVGIGSDQVYGGANNEDSARQPVDPDLKAPSDVQQSAPSAVNSIPAAQSGTALKQENVLQKSVR